MKQLNINRKMIKIKKKYYNINRGIKQSCI